MNWLRKTDDEAVNTHGPVEIWDHFVQTHRFFKRVAIACVALAGIGLAGGSYGMFVALEEPLVFAVGGDGQTIPLGRRKTLNQPVEAEIRFVARRYLEKTLAFRSDSIEADLADAMNLMTSELRKKTESEFRQYQREKGEPFVHWVKSQGIETRLVLIDLHVDAASHDPIVVRARAHLRTAPAGRPFERESEPTRAVDARLTLVRVPRTETTPHGLLVSSSATRFHKAPTKEPSLDLKAKALTKDAAP